uniref:Uncharacterized protein n=1 Tax=Anopheles atroparvus TaxID=41427 RepID=A0A182J3P3_ANOAO
MPLLVLVWVDEAELALEELALLAVLLLLLLLWSLVAVADTTLVALGECRALLVNWFNFCCCCTTPRTIPTFWFCCCVCWCSGLPAPATFSDVSGDDLELVMEGKTKSTCSAGAHETSWCQAVAATVRFL